MTTTVTVHAHNHRTAVEVTGGGRTTPEIIHLQDDQSQQFTVAGDVVVTVREAPAAEESADNVAEDTADMAAEDADD